MISIFCKTFYFRIISKKTGSFYNFGKSCLTHALIMLKHFILYKGVFYEQNSLLRTSDRV